jgi:hypothetical protein
VFSLGQVIGGITMLVGVFSGGVGMYVFYVSQPDLLELWGNPRAYGIAGPGRGHRRGCPDPRRPADPQDPAPLPRRTSALLILQVVATILSFDSLMTSAGGMVAQPALGKSADVWSYQTSYVLSGASSAFALPFILQSR